MNWEEKIPISFSQIAIMMKCCELQFGLLLPIKVKSVFVGSRIYIERPIYKKFKTDFVAKVNRMKIGDPANPDTKMGALVSESHMNKVLSYIELARKEGGRILCGGERTHVDGRCENGFLSGLRSSRGWSQIVVPIKRKFLARW